MALVDCRECGKQVSSQAATCPHCGIASPAPPPRKPNIARGGFILAVIAGLVILAVVQSFTGEKRDAVRSSPTVATTQTVTPPRPPEDPKREAAFQRALLLARAVKASANDPESIEVFEALYTDAGTVTIKYRGRNAFNAKIVNIAIATPDGKLVNGAEKDVATVWNKYVANKPNTDLSSSMRGAKLLHGY